MQERTRYEMGVHAQSGASRWCGTCRYSTVSRKLAWMQSLDSIGIVREHCDAAQCIAASAWRHTSVSQSEHEGTGEAAAHRRNHVQQRQ